MSPRENQEELLSSLRGSSSEHENNLKTNKYLNDIATKVASFGFRYKKEKGKAEWWGTV